MSYAQDANSNSHLSPLTSHSSRGITLIALIITIVIMLILAGITINLTLGENGIFLKAKDAKRDYEIASIKEQIMMEMSEAEINGINNGGKVTRAKMSKILSDNDNVEEIEYDTDSITPKNAVLKNGQKILISDLMDGEEFQGVGPEANSVPSMLVDTNREWDLTKVTPISDGTNIIPIPEGFYYVGGTKDTGVVISDNVADVVLTAGVGKTAHTENKNLQGNQFVWVPVAGKIEDARSAFGNQNWSAPFDSCIDVLSNNYKEEFIDHTPDSLYTENGQNIEESIVERDIDNYGEMRDSVNNYGGFYIARYEASSSDFEGNKTLRESGEKPSAGDVVSKANQRPWDLVDQKLAKEKCENMYTSNDKTNGEKMSVKSLLISSYIWDATLNFIRTDSTKDVVNDSTNWGNYSNRKSGNNIIEFEGYFSNGSWGEVATFTGEKWNYGTQEGKVFGTYLKLATGIAPSTNAKNIYDMAGNMVEWTTEISTYQYANSNNRVSRGGSFIGNGIVSYRNAGEANGNQSPMTYTDISLGFRPQLFIQM